MKRLTLIWTTVVTVSLLGGTLALVEGRRTAHVDARPAQVADARPRAPPIDEVRAGTTLAVALDDSVGSATSHVDDRVRAHFTRPLVVGGLTAVSERSELIGTVTVAERSHPVKGRARVVIQFEDGRPNRDSRP
jgi:hypothetical protein